MTGELAPGVRVYSPTGRVAHIIAEKRPHTIHADVTVYRTACRIAFHGDPGGWYPDTREALPLCRRCKPT